MNGDNRHVTHTKSICERRRTVRPACPRFRTGLLLLAMVFLLPASLHSAESEIKAIIENSRYVLEIPVAKDVAASWQGFAVPPEMFDGARWDLADLRLLDAADNEVPYALRVYAPRSERTIVPARTFNSASSPEGTVELSLDLGEGAIEHNEIDINTPGVGFRRKVTLDGSDDGETWGKLAEAVLVRFAGRTETFQEQEFLYPASRFRYLRVRVRPDSSVDKEPFEIHSVTVRRTNVRPGEFITRPAQVGQREPSRHEGVTGSAWLIDLGGTQVPCGRLEVELQGNEFARDYVVTALADSANTAANWNEGYDPYGRAYYPPPVYANREASRDEAAGPTLTEAFSPFSLARGTWRRRAGEPPAPQVADLGHVRAGKLRLFIADSANEPLQVRSVKYVAPKCLVVLANAPELRGPLRAYYGNPDAEPPNYDFARNLPGKLVPPPAELEVDTRGADNERLDLSNPDYVPPPLPFTERFRWLIHCVLALASLLLAVLVALLARRAIAHHDSQSAETPSASPQSGPNPATSGS